MQAFEELVGCHGGHDSWQNRAVPVRSGARRLPDGHPAAGGEPSSAAAAEPR
jgi:hypothetical protein